MPEAIHITDTACTTDWKGSVFCGDVFLPFMGPIEEEEGRDGTTQNVRGNFSGGDPTQAVPIRTLFTRRCSATLPKTNVRLRESRGGAPQSSLTTVGGVSVL